MTELLVRGVRLVPLDGQATGPLSDVLLREGRVADVGQDLQPGPTVPVLVADGRWAVPGLWDQHVHLTQWGQTLTRLDVSGTDSAEQVARLVAEHLVPGATGFVTGWGYRSARWGRAPTVRLLDSVTGAVPVVLISGDGHNGWLNSAALHRLGLPPREGALAEGEWFDAYTRLAAWPGTEAHAEAGVAHAVAQAHRRGVVGIVDLEWSRTWVQWQHRYGAGLGPLRVRAGVYADRLEEVIAAGRRTGEEIEGTGGLVTMGPFKVITDGSLNTRTAWCCEPYADAHAMADPAGAPNLPVAELTELVARAHRHGLQAALHAIGDQALATVLDVFAATGARGSVEHAQLVRRADLARWAGLPVRASVQPAHLLDDREVTEQCWPDRADRTFAFRDLLAAGIELSLGSDAPVAPLDPWLAMAAAVHRGPLGGPSWHPEQALTPREALAASVDGRRIAPGQPADLVLVEDDPLLAGDPAGQAARLAGMPVAATIVAGQVAWSAPGQTAEVAD